jgi:hypothetical protein
MNPSNEGLQNAAPLKQPDDQHDHGEHDEDVDEVSQVRVVWPPEPERPEQDEKNNDGFEHGLAALHGSSPITRHQVPRSSDDASGAKRDLVALCP